MLLLFMRRNREYMFQSLHFTVTVVRAFKATLLCSFSEICFYFTYAQLCQKHTRLYRAQDHLNRLRSVAKDSMSADRSFFIHYYCISVYVPSLLSAASHHVVCFRVSPSWRALRVLQSISSNVLCPVCEHQSQQQCHSQILECIKNSKMDHINTALLYVLYITVYVEVSPLSPEDDGSYTEFQAHKKTGVFLRARRIKLILFFYLTLCVSASYSNTLFDKLQLPLVADWKLTIRGCNTFSSLLWSMQGTQHL